MTNAITLHQRRLAFIFDGQDVWEQSFPYIPVYHRVKERHPKVRKIRYDWRDCKEYMKPLRTLSAKPLVLDLNADDETTLKIGVIKSYQLLADKNNVRAKAVTAEDGELVSHHDVVDAIWAFTHNTNSKNYDKTLLIVGFALIAAIVAIAAIWGGS